MIVNATAVQFVQDRIRPRCEQIRALLHQMQDDRASWSNVSSIIPNTEEFVQNPGDGVKLQGQDVHTVINRINGLLAYLEQQYYMDAITKSCVRPLGVTL